MTKNEVMAMTDEGLRIKAAELMGLKFHRAFYIWREAKRAGGEPHYGVAGVFDDSAYVQGNAYVFPPDPFWGIPNYPRDITAAWKLLDEWADRGGTYEIVWGGSHCDQINGKTYRDYILLGRIARVAVEIGVLFLGESKAPAVARAITRAFILASERETL
jgi:hypothetical protein